VISAVFKVRKEPTADDWFAAMRERSRLGMAMAAMIRMIATTIKSSISENPLELFLIKSSVAIYRFPEGHEVLMT